MRAFRIHGNLISVCTDTACFDREGAGNCQFVLEEGRRGRERWEGGKGIKFWRSNI